MLVVEPQVTVTAVVLPIMKTLVLLLLPECMPETELWVRAIAVIVPDEGVRAIGVAVPEDGV